MTIDECNIGNDSKKNLELEEVQKSESNYPCNGFIYKSKVLSTDEIQYYISTKDVDNQPLFGHKNLVLVVGRKKNSYACILFSANMLKEPAFVSVPYITKMIERKFKQIETNNQQ